MYKIYNEPRDANRIYLSDEFTNVKGERRVGLLGIDLFDDCVQLFQDSENQQISDKLTQYDERVELSYQEIIAAFEDLISILEYEFKERNKGGN